MTNKKITQFGSILSRDDDDRIYARKPKKSKRDKENISH